MRENLDPIGDVPDQILKDALRESSLVHDDSASEKIELDTKASVLSTGQVQLLALTQSLISFKMKKSRILLMDEPTSQIDEKSQKTILDALIQESKKNQASMIMIAHKLETAVRYSDKIMVMDQGSVNQFDTASNLLKLNEEGEVQASGIFADMVNSLNQQ